ncbi:YgdI/YgdR family lipoprotein [Tatumella terrea]|uniref:YgdI/YgdR family lipoprotein n=1 Tax=Tatumella terrea TaxID=419007 RepID=A0ABW1VZJ1_9GAMM|nr:YgdI/YgdR family lipoprotein [Tatumella sp. JGM118]MBS0910000.1 YgdI/YgdR family lipoprotein [Tatumella sp. JGM118]
MNGLRIIAGGGLMLSALLLGGCSSHYVMATKDGHMIMTQGKPEIDKDTGLVQYTDESGNQVQINGDEISGIIER